MASTHRFASSVVAHNKRQGFVKLHHHLVVRAEGPDPLDQHLHAKSKTFGFTASEMLLLETFKTNLVDCAHCARMFAR